MDYEIRVRGALGTDWSAWFEGLHITSEEQGQTTIAGPIADQAALHGLLAKIRDLGLELLEVRRTAPNPEKHSARLPRPAPPNPPSRRPRHI